jgi:type IV secretory pathway VirB4 component
VTRHRPRLRPSEAVARQRATALAASRAAERAAPKPDQHRPPLWGAGPGLRVDRHRSTLAHLRSLYPFQADESFGHRGPYMGVNITAGMDGFFFDPFELYGTILTNPNLLVIGDVGSGKSAFVKAFLRRSLAVYGHHRFLALLDPKDEYRAFGDAHGIPIVKLHPGGTDRVNPMDPLPGSDPAESIDRQALAIALVAAVLTRTLNPTEDALLGRAIETLARSGQPFGLPQVTAAVQDPDDELLTLAGVTRQDMARAAAPVVFALDKLCRRTLRGMFDGPTTIGSNWINGPGLILDLSAVYGSAEAFPLVMVAATAWFTAVLQRQWDRLVLQVVEEAWAAVLHGARHFQSSEKLSRSYGASTILVCHRPDDLTAQADDGTSNAKIAAGLVSDIQTHVLLRQPAAQIPLATDLFGLSEQEAAVIGQLPRGRALWRLNGRGAIVQNVLTPRELELFSTDSAMATNALGFRD